MDNIFFFQTQTIPGNSNLFQQLKKQNIFYSYFLVNQNYYLFFYAQEPIQIDFIYQFINLVQELDSKQRKIRSLRGFFLYALEIIKNGKDYEILETNLQPFFWKKVHDIIRQNKKSALQEFLFGPVKDRGDSFQSSSTFLKDMENKIKTIQDLGDSVASFQAQVDSLAEQVEKLQQKVIHIETLLNNSKYSFSDTLKASRDIKITSFGPDMEGKKPPYLAVNDPKTSTVLKKGRNSTPQTRDMESKSVSYTPEIDSKGSGTNKHRNLPLSAEKGLSYRNFITLTNLSQEEKIEIIKAGFQLQAKKTISLKKYYESIGPNSLFQLKKYSIKYETIRRTKLYKTLKE